MDRPAEPSRGRLSRVALIALAVYWPMLAVGTHWPNLRLPQAPAHRLQEVLQVDKLAHLVGFGGLMVLVLLSGLVGLRQAWPTRCAWAALGLPVLRGGR